MKFKHTTYRYSLHSSQLKNKIFTMLRYSYPAGSNKAKHFAFIPENNDRYPMLQVEILPEIQIPGEYTERNM